MLILPRLLEAQWHISLPSRPIDCIVAGGSIRDVWFSSVWMNCPRRRRHEPDTAPSPGQASSLGDNLAHVRTSALSSANGRLGFLVNLRHTIHYLGGFQGGRLRCLDIPVAGPKLSPL